MTEGAMVRSLRPYVRRAALAAGLGILAWLAMAGVAGAQEAGDNVFTADASKFIAAGLAMGLGAFGPGSASAISAARRWRRSGAIPRRPARFRRT